MIESLKNLEESNFFQSVNLHIHTNLSDGTLSPQEVIEKAKNVNYKLISITDHNTIDAYDNVSFENNNELKIISGVEFDCWYGLNLIHILGYDFDLNNQKLRRICAKNLNGTRLDLVRFFNRRNAREVIKIIKDAGGIAVLAHPACCYNVNLFKMIKELKAAGLDGIEVYYPYVGYRNLVKFYSTKRIKKIAQELNLIITGGTDCHGVDLRAR